MASTYSALKIELIATGEQSGTWGATTNVNLGDAALGEAITGSADVAFSSADVTITLTDTNTTQAARNLRLNLTGTSGGARNLILGSGCQIEKLYLVNNGLADAVTIKNTTGTGIAIPAGKSAFVFNNGTNVVEAVNYAASISTGAITCTSLTDSGLTSGRVTYAGTAGLLQDSANLTFNGTTLTANTIGAFTLGGTIAGGSNQINNIIIGTTTPLAGSFTAVNATSITNSGLTSGRVVYSTTGGLETDSANLLYSGTDLTVYGLTVGRGAGAVSTNTAVGASALINNTTGSQNTAVGYQSGFVITTGSQNTAFGASIMDQSVGVTGSENAAFGRVNMRFLTSGSNNTATGNAALNALTSGSNNTASGYQALVANDTASNNTAVGYQAGYSNNTGTANVFLGLQTAYWNTTGSSNVSLGYGAFSSNNGSANGTGSFNVAVGRESLANNTTASNNTAVGYQALYSNTISSQNTAVGRLAGYYSQAGAGTPANTYLGHAAGFGDATGYYNTYVGGLAGPNTATTASGQSNTGVGHQALTGLTSGSYNTALGTDALKSLGSASNNLAVGYQAGYTNQTGDRNTFLGILSGNLQTNSFNTFVGARSGFNSTGERNTFVGAVSAVPAVANYGCGELMTTGSKNTILGGYNGNQGGLDIRTASNYVVLSDGDGNPRQIIDGSGNVGIGVTANTTNLGGTYSLLSVGKSGGSGIFMGQSDSTASDSTVAQFFGKTTGASGYQLVGGMLIATDGTSTTDAVGRLQFYTATGGSVSERMRITSAGVLDIGTGAGAVGQIQFPATQVASANANTLDDYEEGTFTPTISGSTSAGTGTYTTQSGSYTKIGRQVSFRLQVFWSAHTGTGGLLVTSLPFTCSGIGGATIGLLNDLPLTALNYAMADIVDNATSVRFRQYPVGGTGITDVAMSNASNIVLSGTYFV